MAPILINTLFFSYIEIVLRQWMIIIIHRNANIQFLSIQINLSTSSQIIHSLSQFIHCCLQYIADLMNGTIIFYSLCLNNNIMCAKERLLRTFFNDPAVALNGIELDIIKFVTSKHDDSLLLLIHLFNALSSHNTTL